MANDKIGTHENVRYFIHIDMATLIKIRIRRFRQLSRFVALSGMDMAKLQQKPFRSETV